LLTLTEIRARYGLDVPEAVHAVVDGVSVESNGDRMPVFYAATEERYSTLVQSDASIVDRAVAAARAAFEQGPWPRMPVAERKRLLSRIARSVLDHADELAALQTIETGIPIAQARRMHVARTAENFEFFGEVASTLAGQTFSQTPGYLTTTVREPVGVAAIFSPWNAPYILSSMKLAAALATGNTVVLKPSEFTPLSVRRLVELCHEAGLPPGAVNLVNGSGPVTGRALAEHPDVDVIGFIGGTGTGKAIMAAAANRVAKVGLELGGKSANIVTDSADLDRAVDGSLLAIFSGSGQQCLAGSRILVQRGIADRFVDAFVGRANAIRLGDPTDPATEMGPVAHAAHRDRILAMVAAAERDGARLLAGGRSAPRFDRGYFVEPTVLEVRDNDLPICQEEVFGPVVTVQVFDAIEEAIAIANHSRFGLVGYVWSDDLPTVMKVTQGVRTGTMWVNTPLVRDLRAPFGGYKESGLGRDGRDACIDLFTEEKTIMLPTEALPMARLGLG